MDCNPRYGSHSDMVIGGKLSAKAVEIPQPFTQRSAAWHMGDADQSPNPSAHASSGTSVLLHCRSLSTCALVLESFPAAFPLYYRCCPFWRFDSKTLSLCDKLNMNLLLYTRERGCIHDLNLNISSASEPYLDWSLNLASLKSKSYFKIEVHFQVQDQD